jgi:hypothetical protein
MTTTAVPVVPPVAEWQANGKPAGVSAAPVDRWPKLDGAAMHGLAGEIASVIDPHTEADPVGVLVSFLVEFGAHVGPTPHAVADSAEHPPRLNAAMVGQTAKGRKGSIGQNVGRVTVPADPRFAREQRLNGFGSGEALVDAVRGSDENGHDPRLLVVEPEFARVLNVARRDGSTLSTIIRQAWDGGRLSVRSRSGTTVADNSHVCVLGHISADELRAKLNETEVAAGFANRFLFVCVKRSKLLPSGGNLDDADLAPFVRKFVSFVAQARQVGIMRRTSGAEELWADLYAGMARDEPGGLLGAVIARDSAQVLRLSVTYALLDGCKSIDIRHVQAAWAVWRYCRDSAAYIFGESIGDPIADRLLNAVRDAGQAGLDGRAQSAVFSGNADRRQLDAARALLESKGLVETVTVHTGEAGRPRVVLVAKRDNELNEQIHLVGQTPLTPVSGVAYEQNERNEQTSADDYWSTADADDYLASLDSEDDS